MGPSYGSFRIREKITVLSRRKFIDKVCEYDFIIDAPRHQSARTVCTAENIETVTVRENPLTSTHKSHYVALQSSIN